ncbi:MAG: folylpolyglutamate synthase/dihydrofolate synthase family protein [Bacteroidota bacterium]
MSYPETVRFLYALQQHGMKFGLRGILALLHALKNPHRSLPVIHVAGTNGKGSTASMLAAILTASGYKTGLYTSPHLLDFSERIRINGRPIGRKEIVRFTKRMRQTINRHQSTFFEATTAMAFAWFAERKVEIAVVEAGLGGRLDSTNVVRPLVSIITSIGLDHKEILGATVEQIAREKAGIIKRKVPCITGVTDRRALRVVRRVCRERSAPWLDGSRYKTRIKGATWEGTSLDLALGNTKIVDAHIGLAGLFQVSNAAMALGAIDLLNKTGRFEISIDEVKKGLNDVQALTGLRGRLQCFRKDPPVFLDVAHNPDAVRTLVRSLQKLSSEPFMLVFGVMRDKDCDAIVRAFAPIVSEAIAVAARTERSLSASDVAAAFSRRRVPVTAALSVREGVELALKRSGHRRPILISGSHFVVGEAMEALASKKVLDNHSAFGYIGR